MANNCWFAYKSEHTKKMVSFFCAKVNATPSASVDMKLSLVGLEIVFYFLISVGLRLTSSGGTGERLRASSSFLLSLPFIKSKGVLFFNDSL